jgi:hypothetical protein
VSPHTFHEVEPQMIPMIRMTWMMTVPVNLYLRWWCLGSCSGGLSCRYDPESGSATAIFHDIGISNGVDFSPDGQTMCK